MGAIYGVIGEAGADERRAMSARLAHRGDEPGEIEPSAGVALGGRGRNAIGTRAAIVCDGDFYDAAPLVERLGGEDGAPGADLLARGYATLGAAACGQVNGDFAFALWDERRETLLLGRDPLGNRPLHYWTGEGVVAFASEYKALLALSRVPARPDRAALAELQRAKFPPAGRTLLEGIRSVPAGHLVEIGRDGAERTHRYFEVGLELRDGSLEEHAARVRDGFLAAVRRRIADLDRVAVELSGGIDSAAIVAAVRAVRPDLPLHTFTCGTGPDDPEILRAGLVARALGSDHHPFFTSPAEVPASLPRLVWHLEDPMARTETALIFAIARHVAEYADVALAGHVADSLYSGMPRHRIVHLIEHVPGLRTPLEELYHYTQDGSLPRSLAGRWLHRAYYRGAHVTPPGAVGAPAPAGAAHLPAGRSELLNRVLLESTLEEVPRWIPKAERLHAAYGVRFRSPFTDPELVRDAFRIPDRHKMRGRRAKLVFREAMRPLLPREAFEAPKFPQAMSYDRALTEVLESLADELLAPEAVRARGLFPVGEIERIRRRRPGASYGSEQAMRVWTAALTELWARTFLDRRGEAPAVTESAAPGAGASRVPEGVVDFAPAAR